MSEQRAFRSAASPVFLPLLVLVFAVFPAAAETMLYWSDRAEGTISRSSLDGSGVETLVSGLPSVQGIAVDPVAGKIYWADTTARSIGRANLNGSEAEVVIAVDGFPKGVDVYDGMVYWTDPVTRLIQRAPADGGEIEDLVASPETPQDLRVDPRTGRVLWVGGVAGLLSLDPATGEVEVATDGFFGQPTAFALADDRARIYWAAGGLMQSVGVFGEGEERLLIETDDVKGMVYEPGTRRLYWSDDETDSIFVADLPDGPAVELLPELARPWRLAVGPREVPPTIVRQPASVVVELNGTASLTVDAVGTGPFQYAWSHDGLALNDDTRISGADGPVLTIQNVTSADIGTYACTVRGPVGEAASALAVVGVLRGCPADLDETGVVDQTDINLFVDILINDTCE